MNEDLIRREDAIKAIEENFWDPPFVHDAIATIRELPSAQPEILACGEGELVIPKQQWVPVSEGLPGYGEDVLVSVSGYCNVGHIVPTNDEKQYNWYYSGWYHDPYDVDAWMPLPEPWKGENDG